MEIAEDVAPYGEWAATLRVVYLAQSIAAIMGGDRRNSLAAARILQRLEPDRPERSRQPVTDGLQYERKD